MYKISIDFRMFNASGIGTYLQNLVSLIATVYQCGKVNLLGNVDRIKQIDWVQGREIELINCKSPIYSVAEQYELYRKISRDTTLFWSPHYNIPLFYKGKLLVTIHDVFHLAMPHLVGGLHKRLYAKGMFTALRYKADAILSVSNFTANELVRLAGIDQKRINVVHNGVDKSWFNLRKDQNPYNKPFLLYVGNVKPHKNLVALIKAFELIIDKIPHDLIIVGKKEGFITKDNLVFDKASVLGDRVHFTGYVKDDMLRQYFVHADALVFPSLYEGFGLPPLEAMACGCPVIVSNAASLPEVCGDAALYCDPYSPEDIANKIQMLMNDANLRESLRQKGLERAKQFSWEKCARETLAVIEKVLSE
jgi:glycosyltransferase involved in cell wall biosynthesis